jgi:hypothetical protein
MADILRCHPASTAGIVLIVNVDLYEELCSTVRVSCTNCMSLSTGASVQYNTYGQMEGRTTFSFEFTEFFSQFLNSSLTLEPHRKT